MTVLTAVSAEQAAQARIGAQAALDAKDALHAQLGANVDREIGRVTDAWQRVEVALQAERLAWISAHGSAALRQQAEDALGAGRTGGHSWRAGVPLEWDQAERLSALQPQLVQEWMACHRSGWVTWDPSVYAAINVEALHDNPPWPRRGFPDVDRIKAAVDFMQTARSQDPSAQLHQFDRVDDPEGRGYRCAIAAVRFPGGYAPVKIALLETPELASQLDRIAEYTLHPLIAECTYEEALAAVVEVDTNQSLAVLSEGVTRGVLWRIDIGTDVGPWYSYGATEIARAVVVSEHAAHLVLVDREVLRGAEGKEVFLGKGLTDERVFIEAEGAPVAVGYEDVDAMQQLQLRRELIRGAAMGRRPEEVREGARSQLHEISRRAEARIDVCRAQEHGAARHNDQDDLLGPRAPNVDRVRRDSALATERLAWVVAHGSQKLLAQSSGEIAASLHDEWVRTQTGWRVRGADERSWKRVAIDGGPNTVHPKLTLRDAAPVKELMADAWVHAPDAFLAVRMNGGDWDDKRPVHSAVIARRPPGVLQREALLREETVAQARQLDVEWKVRLRARGAEDRLPHCLPAALDQSQPPQNATEKMTERVQREFGLPGAALPEATPVAGRLARIELGSDHRHRAVVVSAKYVHVVSVLPTMQLQELVGKHITVEKTAGRVKIARQPQERELAR